MHQHLTVLNATLLGFAGWTLAVLTFTVGVHRWSRILTGRSAIHEFPADASTGPDWYRRATRAHLNCVENLPVYGAIVFVASSVGAAGTLLDTLGVVILCARVVQTTVHVAFVESRRTVSVRFSFFFVQLIAMSVMIVALLVGETGVGETGGETGTWLSLEAQIRGCADLAHPYGRLHRQHPAELTRPPVPLGSPHYTRPGATEPRLYVLTAGQSRSCAVQWPAAGIRL